MNDHDLLTDEDFEGIEPKPNSSKWDYLMLVTTVALAKFQNGQSSMTNPANEREKEGRDKSQNGQSSMTNPHLLISIPKGKRTSLTRTGTVSSSTPDKKRKVEAIMTMEREERFTPDMKPINLDQVNKKTRSPRGRKQTWSDIGCSDNGENTRPKKMVKKTEDFGPDPPPDLPQIFKDKIKALNGRDLFRVMQKRLTTTDVDKNKYRMSIPRTKIENEFLKGEEKAALEPRKVCRKVQDMEVELLEPSCERVTKLSLRNWEMKKETGKSSFIYNLVNKNWYKNVVESNGLSKGTVVQLWSFRVEGKLQFALVKVGDGGDGADGRDGGDGESGDGCGSSSGDCFIGRNC